MYRKLGRTLLGDPKAAPPLGATGTGASSNISNTAGSTTGVGISSLVLNAGGGGAVGMNEDSQPPVALGGAGSSAETHFRVGEVLGVWYRPSLDRHMYPYCPPHVTRPMEVRTIFLIHVLDVFSAASAGGLRLVTGGGYDGQMELVAVPLFELMDNAGKYGIVASSIPYVVSRLHINFC
jgi:cleavage and polyadenylation specificity factor subunit 5